MTTLAEDVSANVNLVEALDNRFVDLPYQPPPEPSLLNAVHTWLRANGHEPTTLRNGKALLLPLSNTTGKTIRHRLKRFAAEADLLQLPSDIVPHEADVRHARCWPRVLLAVAHAINNTDPDGWLQAGGEELPDNWQAVALDETWEGDAFAREIVNVTGGCTIVVAGSQGSGKSATIQTLLGKSIIPHSHALMYWPDTNLLDEEQRRQRYRYQQVAAACWPISPIEMDLPVGGCDVDRVYAKLDGKVLQIVELPSMEPQVDIIDSVGTNVETQYGNFRDVLFELQRNVTDVILLVERMDDLRVRNLKSAARKLRRLYGKAVWQRTVVILTHGKSLPPGDMQYAVWKYDCLRLARETVKQVSGEDLPAFVVENSGEMPDGSSFKEEFIATLRQIATRGGIKVVPMRQWWEDLVLLGLLTFLLPRAM